MLFIALLVAAVGGSPSPAPQIAHVHTSAYCTSFREQVMPSVQGLLANDSLVSASQRILYAMQADSANQAPGGDGDEDGSLTLDKLHLDMALQDIVENLKKFDGLLAKLDDQIAHAAPQDAGDLKAMRAQIVAVMTQQRAELYLFSGLLSTDQLGGMETNVNTLRSVTMPDAQTQMQRSLYGSSQTTGGAGKAPTVSAVDTATQNDTAARQAQTLEPGAAAAVKPATTMQDARANVAREEGVLAVQITTAANACGLVKPSPSPSPR